jgi:signal transduction histidine kinase
MPEAHAQQAEPRRGAWLLRHPAVPVTVDLPALMLQRTRGGLLVILATIGLFALLDLGIDAAAFRTAYALKLLHASLIAVLLISPSRVGDASRWPPIIALVSVNGTFALMAIGDVVKGHVETTPLLAVVTALSAAALLPWGVRLQLWTAAFMCVGTFVVLLGTGRPPATLVDPLGSVAASLAVSVYVAYEFARYRAERRAAEQALARQLRLEVLRADVRLEASRGRTLAQGLHSCCEALVEHVDAAFARVWTLGPDGQTLELRASAGLYTHLDGAHARVRVGTLKIGRIAASREPHVTNDVANDPHVSDREWARREGMVAFAGYPLVASGRLLGVVAMFSRELLDERTAAAVASVADAIAIHIERASTEEALHQLVDELDRANRAKLDFVSTMSHELRTPLHIIAGYGDMLNDPDFTERARALEGIRRANAELLDLVEATLDLNRLESGRDQPHVTTVELEDLWDELATELSVLPHAAGVHVRWHRDAGAALQTDRRKVKIILKNLVGNALKFTHRGGVDVWCRVEGERCVVSVSDTGIGIAPEHLATVFEPFRQLDGSDRRRYGGVGLGLHIVQRLCAQLGAQLAVTSEPGRGSTFTLRLPLSGPAAHAA